MTIQTQFSNTRPKKEVDYWQFDLLPAIGVLYMKKYDEYPEYNPPYVAISLQWAFWQFTILIK